MTHRNKKIKRHSGPRAKRGRHVSSIEAKITKTAAWLTHIKRDEGRTSVPLGEMQEYYRAA